MSTALIDDVPVVADGVREGRKSGEAESTPGNAHSGLVRRTLMGIHAGLERLFGCFVLIAALSVLATVPILQMLSLGYLLEASGRVGRSGKLWHGFVGVGKAARIGGFVLGVWLLLWPLRVLGNLLNSARIIDPASDFSRRLGVMLAVATTLVLAHIASVGLRGGRLRSFLWPRPIRFIREICSRRTYAEARDRWADFVESLRLPHYFSLGLRGFVGGWLWLLIPVSLLAAGQRAPLLGLAGGVLLSFLVLYVLMAQTHFAVENRFRALFEWGALRRTFARAPIAFLIALVAALAFATPLYLFKIEITPREAAWLPSLFFVLFAWPARLLAGWAYARGRRREQARWFFVRWPARALMFPVAALFAFITFLTQYTSWYGVWSLYEQHAFLVPAPFLGY